MNSIETDCARVEVTNTEIVNLLNTFSSINKTNKNNLNNIILKNVELIVGLSSKTIINYDNIRSNKNYLNRVLDIMNTAVHLHFKTTN